MQKQNEQFNYEVVHRPLSDDENQVIQGVAEATFDAIKDEPEHVAVARGLAAGREVAPVLSDLAQEVGAFATHKAARVMVIDGPKINEDELPPTPENHLSPAENHRLLADQYRLTILGMVPDWYPYGYTSQQPGNILNNVIAIKDWYGVDGVSANAQDMLGLHTEDASFNQNGANISPDTLTLHFLRNPDGVASVASIPNFGELSEDDREILFTPFFHNLTNKSQGGEDNNTATPISVLYGDREDPWIRLNTSGMDIERYTPEQQRALKNLRDLVIASSVDVNAGPGQIVLIDNRRVMHGRAKYNDNQMPRFDGKDRWQRRLVISDNASRIKPFESSPRIVDPPRMFRHL